MWGNGDADGFIRMPLDRDARMGNAAINDANRTLLPPVPIHARGTCGPNRLRPL